MKAGSQYGCGRFLIPAFCLFLGSVSAGVLAGCAVQNPHLVNIPKQCFHVNITSFRKPCEEIPSEPGFVVCDRVKAKVECIEVRPQASDRRPRQKRHVFHRLFD